jgi:3-deoxy-manno-octulosonate cytidylyltransferase (CMP-KDO synthetase)
MPDGQAYYRHIGLYAYRVGFIQHYLAAEVCPLERTESLEQLRVLYMGHKIRIAQAIESTGQGVDTEADLLRVETALGKK